MLTPPPPARIALLACRSRASRSSLGAFVAVLLGLVGVLLLLAPGCGSSPSSPTLAESQSTVPTSSDSGSEPGSTRLADAGWIPIGPDRGLGGGSGAVVVSDHSAPGTVYIGTEGVNGGVFKTTNDGSAWTLLPNTSDVDGEFIQELLLDSRDPRRLYLVQGLFESLYHSEDAGATWARGGNVNQPQINDLVVDQRDWRTLYAAELDDVSGGVFRSVDAGRNWTEITANLPTTSVYAIEVHPTDPEILYVGTDRGVFKSVSAGAAWSPVNSGLPTDSDITELVLDPAMPDSIYAIARDLGVVRSTDGGLTWVVISSGLPDPRDRQHDVHCLLLDSASPGTMYAGTSEGVFRTQDGGASWSSFNDGMTLRDVFGLTIGVGGDILYAATEGRGEAIGDALHARRLG